MSDFSAFTPRNAFPNGKMLFMAFFKYIPKTTSYVRVKALGQKQ